MGVLEVIEATAKVVTDSFRPDPTGPGIDFDYTGETEINWESRAPRTRRGKKLFVCESGAVVMESRLTLRTDQDGGAQ